jgi:hypothetical protein
MAYLGDNCDPGPDCQPDGFVPCCDYTLIVDVEGRPIDPEPQERRFPWWLLIVLGVALTAKKRG